MEHYTWHKQNPNGYCLYCGGDPKDIGDLIEPVTPPRCICGVLKTEHHAALDGHAYSEHMQVIRN